MPSARWKPLLAKVAVSATLLYLVALHASVDDAAARLSGIDLPWALAAFTCVLVATFFVGVRWQRVASAVARPIGVWQAWFASLVGAALDQVLVAMSGDAYRAWWLRRGARSVTHAVSAVILDRVVGVLGVAMLVLLFITRFATLEGAPRLVWLPVALAVGAFACCALLLAADRLPLGVSRNRWLARLAVLAKSARIVFRSPGTLLLSLGCAVLAHVAACAAVTMLARALHIELSLVAALTVVPTVILISMVPISVGGWGVREGAMVLALGIAGVRAGDAFLLSVAYGLSMMGIAIAGGLTWLAGVPGNGADELAETEIDVKS
jgi:uncharacterized membrane protein YbhN (UPF0104 family)